MTGAPRLRILAGLLLVLLLAPSALCFASAAPQAHACCAPATSLRSSGTHNCCAFSSAPVPVQAGTAPVAQFDQVAAPLLAATHYTPVAAADQTLAMDCSPPSAIVLLASNLRI